MTNLEQILPAKIDIPDKAYTCNQACVNIGINKGIDMCFNALRGKVGVIPSEEEIKRTSLQAIKDAHDEYDSNYKNKPWIPSDRREGKYKTLDDCLVSNVETAIRSLMLNEIHPPKDSM